jgi:hypothetical protein
MLGPPSSQYQAYVQRAKTYAHLRCMLNEAYLLDTLSLGKS